MEAAGDLTRSLAELDGGDLVEEVDGGVGDDSGETILKPGGPSGSLLMSNSPAPEGGPYMVFPPAASLSPRDDAGSADSPSLPISDHRSRRAWLQCLLF